ncbi:valine--tRNA ligase [Tsuneonella sp. HG094]
MSTELDKTFDPAAIEARWYAHWESAGLFRPERPDARPFTIVNPPPNVTGSLHIGHALDNTLQDVVIRYERMRGKDALWVVGTDHAGIATQMVVERQMAERQDKRTNYSREDFVAKVWEWKHESGGTITRQLRRLGCSMDWSREQFTMDPHFSAAVIKVFVDLYNQGLLYRDKRLVNWDPALKTAISDLEVESREVQGHMWHFKYPLAGGETYTYVERDADGTVTLEEERDYISIATTRPETMLGDGAVAVHPSDARYAPIVGKLCEIPVGPKEHRRLIPIITDEYPDPDFGSGAVKITGAHDENDYGVAQRGGIPMYRLMDEVAAMRTDGASYAEAAARAGEIAQGASFDAKEIDALNLVPDEYRGLDRYEARKRVVADIDAEGLMLGIEDKVIMQPFGDRGGVVIEPMLTDQWYVDAKTLAQAPIEAVKDGRIEIVPKTWEKTFFNWMENIQPWCVSRQLWWGHRIPAWYDADGKCYVAETEEAAQALAGAGVALTRDEDVLDTWFSSALWPFATLGWPEQTDLVARHYPNDLLISGFDILFFWDARMAMQGMHFMQEVPWKRLYLHGLVRAADGAKMSKSKGNVVDPLGLIDRFGADALRFFMCAMESQGRDVKMDESRVEGYRNFATKLWNATRFCQANGIGASQTLHAPEATQSVHKWIIGEVVATQVAVDKAMSDLRFDAAAGAIYRFVWDTFCDWYLEFVKGYFSAEKQEGIAPEAMTNRKMRAEESRVVTAWVLDQILVMLHPFMPFITEELWHAQGERPYELIIARWPETNAEIDEAAALEIRWLIETIRDVRSARALLNVPPSARPTMEVYEQSNQVSDYLYNNQASFMRLARVRLLFPQGGRGTDPLWNQVQTRRARKGAILIEREGFAANIPVAEYIDIEAEKARLAKALATSEKEAASLAGRLGNASFVERAKPEAVEKARADHAHHAAEAERLKAALARLG